MKRFIIFTLALLITGTTYAQPQKVESTCDAPDSVIAKYKTDAQRIALSRIYRVQSTYKDSAVIPDSYTDTILRALIAVYNVPLVKTDTVNGDTINLMDLHGRTYQAGDMHAYPLNGWTLGVDVNEQWVKDLKQNIFPTSNTAVNALMNKYHTQCSHISQYINYAFFESSKNYNIPVVAKEWMSMPGVTKSELSGGIGDGSYLIADSITNNYVSLVYSYGYGDCPAGCINRRNWRYKVYYNCDVEFVNTWEGQVKMPPVPTNIPTCQRYINTTTVTPNPFNDYILLDNTGEYIHYSIADIQGRIVKQGTPVNGRIENLQDLNKGIYILLLKSENGVGKAKIVK